MSMRYKIHHEQKPNKQQAKKKKKKTLLSKFPRQIPSGGHWRFESKR